MNDDDDQSYFDWDLTDSDLRGSPARRKNYSRRNYSHSCWTTHQPLVIPHLNGETYEIEGGNCGHPTEGTQDSVGLCAGTYRPLTPNAYPWSNAGYSFCFPITNNDVPNSKDFKKLINWIEKRLIAGRRIHVGCIGGHGRTGLVFAALYMQCTGDDNATQIVRDTYCKKAVESQIQVDFLAEHYGNKPVLPRYGKAASKKRKAVKPIGRNKWR